MMMLPETKSLSNTAPHEVTEAAVLSQKHLGNSSICWTVQMQLCGCSFLIMGVPVPCQTVLQSKSLCQMIMLSYVGTGPCELLFGMTSVQEEQNILMLTGRTHLAGRGLELIGNQTQKQRLS